MESPPLSAPTTPPPSVPDLLIFRREALEAHLREIEGKGILKVSPLWSWTLVVTLGSLVLAGLIFSFFGKLEVTSKGPGILRPAAGVRRLTAPGPGVVAEVLAHTGVSVRAGDPILRLEFPALLGSALEADQALRAKGREFAEVARSRAMLYQLQVRTADERILALTRENASYRRGLDRAGQHLAAHRELYRQGIIGKLEADRYEDQFEESQRAVAASDQSLRQAKQDRTFLETQRREQTWSQTTDEAQARSRRDSLEFSLRQSLLTAPVDGNVDGLVLKPGDQVQGGAQVAKVVPADAPLQGIAFLDEKDRAFVKEGDRVDLELAQFPHSEFGTLRGRVERVGSDLASATEIADAFGTAQFMPEQPRFKVLIRLEVDGLGGPGRMTLRSGMTLKARFTLRRQRLVTLVIEPLQRWLR